MRLEFRSISKVNSSKKINSTREYYQDIREQKKVKLFN